MLWRRDKPAPLALIEGETLNLKALSPSVSGILKACLGKLDPETLEHGDREQIQLIFKALQGPVYTLYTKGMFTEYGAQVERIKAQKPNPKRK